MIAVRLSALVALVALMGASAASYGRCDSGGQPALGIVQVTGGDAGSTFYVDDRGYATGNGTWIYEESNGIWSGHGPGIVLGDPEHKDLQRGSACGGIVALGGGPRRCIVPEDNEICADFVDVQPDQLVL